VGYLVEQNIINRLKHWNNQLK